MDRPRIFTEPVNFDHRSELEHAISDWHAAALRLEQAHESLRTAVGRLTDDLETKTRELARQNRLAELGQMATHVVQEVYDQLAPVSGDLSLLRRRIAGDAPSIESLDKVESGLLALDATLGDLLSFTSNRDPKLQWVPLRQVIDDVCHSLAQQLAAHDVETAIDVPRNLAILADRKMLRCAVLNLSINALDAMPEGGRLVVTSYIGRNGLELEIADSGPGLSEDVRRQVFKPFFTTKTSGTGLGLAIVNRIAEVHGGDVVAANCPEGGAAFTLRFPQRAQAAA